MTSGAKIVIFCSLAVVTAVVLIIMYLQGKMSWEENYKMDSSNPYGTKVISTILKNINAGKKFHEIRQLSDSTLKDFHSDKIMNYVFIGNIFHADSTESDELLDFIGQGNNAFISANSFPGKINKLFYNNDCNDEFFISNFPDSIITLNLVGNLKTDPATKIKYNYEGYFYKNLWNYFDSSAVCTEDGKVSALGTIENDKINFVHVPYGRGNLFLHLTPIAFTNYHLVHNDAQTYAEHALSVLPEGDIIWDEYSKLPKYFHNVNEQGENTLQGEGPLSFILSRDGLRWAWYLSLSLLVIYVLFIGKRRQRVIPVIEPNRNTSLEYIKTVGKLYYQERDHRSVCIHKMKHFQSFLRNRYFILTTQRDDELFGKIAMVSGVNIDLVKSIFIQFALIDVRTELTDKELIDFHISLTKFYKDCI